MIFNLSDIFTMLADAVKDFFDFLNDMEFTVNGVSVSYFWGILGAFAAETILSNLFERKDDEK